MKHKHSSRKSVDRIAREIFGYEQLRPGQEAALQAILQGHDTLVVMPTGAGKAMICQAAGRLIPGPTLIVSPLIALQRDQVGAIEEQAFMDDELEVIVATNAFGMGIDKENVRFVFHYDISDSVDSYYQEIGRAGRDGEASQAILLYCSKDLGLRYFLASNGHIDAEQVELVFEAIQRHEGAVDPKDLREDLNLSQTKIMQVITRLEEVGVIETLPTGEVMANEHPPAVNEAAEEAVHMQESRRQFERSRIEMIRNYAELHDCRREYLLNYFGEPFEKPCNSCDNCEAGFTLEAEEGERPFPLNSRVIHKSWGEGQVLRYEGDKIVVLFDGVGYKSLSTTIVTERNLLESA